MKPKSPRSRKHSTHPVKRRHPLLSGWFSQHYLWYIGMGFVIGLLFWLLKPVFALLAASAAIAYILDPLIDRFEENGWSRDQGIAIITGLGGLLLLIGLISFIPPIIEQINKLSDDMRVVLSHLDESLQQTSLG